MFLSLVARKLVSIGVTANMITLIGFCVNVLAAFFLATGRLVLAGVLILFGGTFDMLDGAAARAAPKSSESGALLDSVVDRYSEGAVFLGALIYFYTSSKLLRRRSGLRRHDWINPCELRPRTCGRAANRMQGWIYATSGANRGFGVRYVDAGSGRKPLRSRPVKRAGSHRSYCNSRHYLPHHRRPSACFFSL